MLERVYRFIKVTNISFNKFEKSIQVSHGSISNAWKNKKNVGSNVVSKILAAYPEISAEWLLRGKGQMFLPHELPANADSFNEEMSDSMIVSQVIRFLGLEGRIDLLRLLSGALSLPEAGTGTKGHSPFQELILNTWDDRYGQEFKSMKHQLDIFFKDKLEREKRLSDKGADQAGAV